MYVRRTLKELGELATREIGFCVGIYWRSVRESHVPKGQISANCRLAYVLFTGFAPAERFYDLLTRMKVERLPRHKIRLVKVTHQGQTATGVTVIASSAPTTMALASGGRRRASSSPATSATSTSEPSPTSRSGPGGTASLATTSIASASSRSS